MNDRETSYDVRIWSILRYDGQRRSTYTVRWKVDGKRWRKTFPNRAQADAYRSELNIAVRNGEPFEIATGQPLSAVRRARDGVSWYDFACRYVDLKWPAASPKHRKSIAEALITVTPIMLDTAIDSATAKEIRSALLNWGYTARRGTGQQPPDTGDLLGWVARHSRPLTDLGRPDRARAALGAIGTKLDGARASAATARLKRTNLAGALDYAVELGLLDTNPIRSLKWKAPRSTNGVDRRVVINPNQARELLAAVQTIRPSGPRLAAFFGCLYYSALRPEEAAELRRGWLQLPEESNEWGWILLEQAAPEVDQQWTDSQSTREARELKHRAPGATRRAPIPPPLAELL
ncbi:MAG: hypothetical protein ACRCYU_04235, partial [Nocardioides sp.]